MEGMKEKITSKVTGDAYKKPAITKDGAMTTQDSSDAHTVEGTAADPNMPGKPPGGEKVQNMENTTEKAIEKDM